MAYDSFSERYARQMQEREEQLKQQKLEQQLKFKKMFKTIGAAVVGFFLLVFLFIRYHTHPFVDLVVYLFVPV